MRNGRTLLTGLLMATVLGACSLAPRPFDQQSLEDTAADRLARVTALQEPITGTIDLYEAMARALKYNLDYKVEVRTQALRNQELKLVSMDLLPTLAVNAGYLGRSNDPGGRSVLIEPPFTESLANSTSQQREHNTTDLGFSWNILDFGLSYVRAQQRSDDVLLAMEQRRKVANRIIEDVRTAYWRAVSSQRLLSELESLDAHVNEALSNSTNLLTRSKSSPLEALVYQRELMSVKLQIKALNRDFAIAKRQLATLMNVAPNESFSVVVTDNQFSYTEIQRSHEELVEQALRDRPELRELSYRMRINGRETTAALLNMLPGLKLDAGQNFDSNDFLFNQDWGNWGASVSWNLVNILRFPSQRRKVRSEQELLDQQALATAMAVMSQVHISLARYAMMKDELKTNSEYLDIQNEIDRNYTVSRDAGRIGPQKWIRERMNTVVAKSKRDIAYAEMQNVYANIYASIGQDAFPRGVSGEESVSELSELLRTVWSDR